MITGSPLSSTPSTSIAERLGLAGVTVLPIPTTDVVATVRRLAEEHSRRLDTDLSTQDTLIFYGATAAYVDAIEEAVEEDGDGLGRITFFGEEDAGLLFLRMVKPVYEVAHLSLFLHIWRLTLEMGLKRNCYAVGTSTYKGIGTRSKQGDSGLRPDPPRDFGNDFPTLVTEAGNSESLARLYKDKDWRFDNSPLGGLRGDVKVVLVVKVYRWTKRILLEQWYRGYQSPSQTITIIPHPYHREPFSPEEQELPTNRVVTGAPMIIPPEDMFLRPRRRGAKVDFVLPERDLAMWAVGSWKADRSR